jgi:predicted aspartyl protease
VNGYVDRSGRALIELRVRAHTQAKAVQLTAWVDTAITGELVVPLGEIRRLGLTQSAAITGGLADGTQVVLETYNCLVEWFESERSVEVIESNGVFALLGLRLLRGHRLEIDYRLQTLLLE